MEARDHANNSRFARRLVIFDNTSDITLNTEDDGKLFVSSADALNNYTWQTTMNGKGRIFYTGSNHKFVKRSVKILIFKRARVFTALTKLFILHTVVL